MVGVLAWHKINAAMWLRQASEVQILKFEEYEWQLQQSAKALVQTAGSSNSSPEERQSVSGEATSIVVFIDPDVDVEVGDRIRWDDEDWQVNSSEWRRTDRAYRRLFCSITQSGVQEEELTFTQVLHDDDGLPLGEVDVATLKVRFTQTMDNPTSQPPTIGSEGFPAAAATTGDMLIETEDQPLADNVDIGHGFVRHGIPGRVIFKSTAFPGVILLAYEMEGQAI